MVHGWHSSRKRRTNSLPGSEGPSKGIFAVSVAAFNKSSKTRTERAHANLWNPSSTYSVYLYRYSFWGEHRLELGSVNASLVESASGRMTIISNDVVAVVEEPYAFKFKQNFLSMMDPGLQVDLKSLMDRSDEVAKGNRFERYTMIVSRETFKTRRLSDWPHQPSILSMCPALAGQVETVGWKDPCLLQATHAILSLEEFMDAHVNHHSTRNNLPVIPFFSPRYYPSEPGVVFFIRVDGRKVLHVFVQMRMHQSSAKLYKSFWNTALATVSASCIQDHAKKFPELLL